MKWVCQSCSCKLEILQKSDPDAGCSPEFLLFMSMSYSYAVWCMGHLRRSWIKIERDHRIIHSRTISEIKLGFSAFWGSEHSVPTSTSDTADIDFCPSVFADLIDSTPAVYAHAILWNDFFFFAPEPPKAALRRVRKCSGAVAAFSRDISHGCSRPAPDLQPSCSGQHCGAGGSDQGSFKCSLQHAGSRYPHACDTVAPSHVTAPKISHLVLEKQPQTLRSLN